MLPSLRLVLSRLLLLDDAQLDSLSLGERDHRLSTLADHEHVRQTSGELVTTRVSHVDDIERTEVTVTTHNHTHTTRVVSLRDVITRSAIMQCFGDEQNKRISRMWTNIRCFEWEDLF